MSGVASQMRILVVDDHPLLRGGVTALVSSQSDMSVVAQASNGREAIQQFRAHHPDVTLMDLQLPEMNERDRQARKCQSQEETQSDASALPCYGTQKRRHRDVDHKRADNVVEMPLRFIGLESVVTANATLFVRDGRIDCAEHQFAIDIQQL